MTHLLLATFVASPLHARLSLLIMMVAELIVVDEAARTTVNRSYGPWTTPLPLQCTIGSVQAANAHRAGRA